MIEKQRKMTIKLQIEDGPRENKDRYIYTKLGKMQGGKKGQDADNTLGKVSSSVPDLQNNY